MRYIINGGENVKWTKHSHKKRKSTNWLPPTDKAVDKMCRNKQQSAKCTGTSPSRYNWLNLQGVMVNIQTTLSWVTPPSLLSCSEPQTKSPSQNVVVKTWSTPGTTGEKWRALWGQILHNTALCERTDRVPFSHTFSLWLSLTFSLVLSFKT